MTPVFQRAVLLLSGIAFHFGCSRPQPADTPSDASQTPANPSAIEQLRDPIDERLAFFGLDVDETKAFFEKLRSSVEKDNRQLVASMVNYPIAVRLHDRRIVIEDMAEFVESYDGIITERVRRAVLDQSFEELFVNWRGVMVGTGQIWLTGICRDDECSQYDLRIIAINN